VARIDEGFEAYVERNREPEENLDRPGEPRGVLEPADVPLADARERRELGLGKRSGTIPLATAPNVESDRLRRRIFLSVTC
jgi:hypothetical protein